MFKVSNLINKAILRAKWLTTGAVTALSGPDSEWAQRSSIRASWFCADQIAKTDGAAKLRDFSGMVTAVSNFTTELLARGYTAGWQPCGPAPFDPLQERLSKLSPAELAVAEQTLEELFFLSGVSAKELEDGINLWKEYSETEGK